MDDAKRRSSLELSRVKDGMSISPPAPPSNISIREWFAGLALGNPELMRDVEPERRALEAVRLADQMMRALASPRMPSQETMDPPTPEQFNAWDQVRESQRRETARLIPSARISSGLPPVLDPTLVGVRRASESFKVVTELLKNPTIPPPAETMRAEPGLGRYSVIEE